MFVVKHKNIFFTLSGILVVLSISAIALWGLPLGIDFTGGSIVEVRYTDDVPVPEALEETLALSGYEASVRPTGNTGYIIRTPFLSEVQHQEVLELLHVSSGEAVEERFSSVGPTIGEELRRKALYAISFVVVLIVFYIAFAFRKVSEPVSSWKYAAAAIVALIHDILIPTGVIAVLGKFAGAQADTLFVMALLAILGLSVNDTIVVFDRIRERLALNKEKGKGEKFEKTVGKGLSQTYTRSINTSLTTLLVLLALFFIGGATIHTFVLTLIVGVIAGTYSSIFLASPLLIVFIRNSKG